MILGRGQHRWSGSAPGACWLHGDSRPESFLFENDKGGVETFGPAYPTPLPGHVYLFFPENPEGMIAAFLASEIDVALDLLQADYDAIKGVDPTKGKALLEAAWEYEHLDMNQAGLGQGKVGRPPSSS